MGSRGVLFVGTAIRDMTVHDNQGRPFGLVYGRLNRPRQHLQVIRVAHPLHVPMVGQEAGGHILTKSQRGVAFNGNVIVVIKPDEVAEPKMSRKRGCLSRNALHHTAIARDGEDVVVNDFVAGAVEVVGQPPLCNGHTDAIGHALS